MGANQLFSEVKGVIGFCYTNTLLWSLPPWGDHQHQNESSDMRVTPPCSLSAWSDDHELIAEIESKLQNPSNEAGYYFFCIHVCAHPINAPMSSDTVRP